MPIFSSYATIFLELLSSGSTTLTRPPETTASTRSEPSQPRNLFYVPFGFVLLAAGVLVGPFFWLGNPSGHDFEFHLNSWMEVLRQWQHGILYPRWAAFAHATYGEPRFVFYPPFSWTLGAILGAFLPWKAAPGAYVLLVSVLSGCAMFLLARTWLERRDAIFAAVFYGISPYAIVVVYWRSALAELLAGALLPLLLLWVLRIRERGRATIIPLAIILAAAWLTNLPAAVMIHYSLALMILMLAVTERTPKVFVYGAGAVLLGAMLAAFYLVPVAYEIKWVNISEVLAPGVRPQDNFLFTTINDADHNRFNFLISLVAAAEIVALAGVIAISGAFRKAYKLQWRAIVTWGVASVLLMLPVTNVAWEHLPKLRFVQLPWRWLLCLNVVLALLLATAVRRWALRILLCLAMLSTIWYGWRRVQAPWWDQAADIKEMQDNIQDDLGYEGTDEYVPAGADPYEIDKSAPRLLFEPPVRGDLKVRVWEPESKSFTAQLTEPGNVLMKLFNFPAWRVIVNGRATAVQSREETGQLVIPLPAGRSDVEVRFARTRDRIWGGILSLVAFICLTCLMVFDRRAMHVKRPLAGAPSV